jgi:hypothetical protein
VTVKIIGGVIRNCGTGISAPKDAALEVTGTEISGCRVAIELRDPPSLLMALGLAPDTPPAVLKEVLAFMATGASDPASVRTKAEASGLLRWLSAGANSTTLIQGLVGIANSGLLQNVLAMLPK